MVNKTFDGWLPALLCPALSCRTNLVTYKLLQERVDRFARGLLLEHIGNNT